jgi:hypothetical protein
MKTVSYILAVGLALAVGTGVGAQTAEPKPAPAEQAAPQSTAVPAPTPAPNPVILTVNGDPIHAADVSMAMQSLSARAQQAGAKVSREELFQNATQQVVETKLLAQEAGRQEVKVDTEQVDKSMQKIEQQAGGRPALEAALAHGGMTYDDLKARVAENSMVEQLIKNKIEPTVQVSEKDLSDYYAANPDKFKSPDGTMSFEQVHDQLKAGLTRDKVSQTVGSLIEKLTAAAAIVPAAGAAPETSPAPAAAPNQG